MMERMYRGANIWNLQKEIWYLLGRVNYFALLQNIVNSSNLKSSKRTQRNTKFRK